MPVVRFSHIAIRVSDVGRSRRFYRDVLGFRERTELSIVGGPTALLLGKPEVKLDAVFLERDGTQIEIQQIDHEGADERAGFVRIGLAHIALRVQELDRVVADAVAAGGELLEKSRLRNAQLGSQVVFIADPDGTTIELIEAPGDPSLPPGEPVEGSASTL
ncbi:MAG: VOC family protein [Deltaproteobacteria bacterium]|nr:VOC family protein [Deltaproteobacteria bacterium]MBW2363041.1 VOC family protein [Deltaproteobacteria bacterium]